MAPASCCKKPAVILQQPQHCTYFHDASIPCTSVAASQLDEVQNNSFNSDRGLIFTSLRLPENRPSATTHAGAQQLDLSKIDPRESASSALPSFIEEIERKAIEQALVDNRYNKTRAASQLGITFRALRYKLKKLGID